MVAVSLHPIVGKIALSGFQRCPSFYGVAPGSSIHFDVIYGDIARQTAYGLVSPAGRDSQLDCGVAGAFRSWICDSAVDEVTEEHPQLRRCHRRTCRWLPCDLPVPRRSDFSGVQCHRTMYQGGDERRVRADGPPRVLVARLPAYRLWWRQIRSTSRSDLHLRGGTSVRLGFTGRRPRHRANRGGFRDSLGRRTRGQDGAGRCLNPSVICSLPLAVSWTILFDESLPI